MVLQFTSATGPVPRVSSGVKTLATALQKHALLPCIQLRSQAKLQSPFNASMRKLSKLCIRYCASHVRITPSFDLDCTVTKGHSCKP